MKKITLEITPELDRLLVQFLHTDNRGTRSPIYLVQTKDEKIIRDCGDSADNYSGGKIKWEYWGDCGAYYYETVDEVVKAHSPLKADFEPYSEMSGKRFNTMFIVTEDDYLAAYEVSAKLVSVVHEWRTVAYFFSEEEARRYTEYQSHNLIEPRTYAAGPGYSNDGDWEPFYKLLQEAARQCEDTLETPEIIIDNLPYLNITEAEYYQKQCCMCPNDTPNLICPGVPGTPHPEPTPCKLFK